MAEALAKHFFEQRGQEPTIISAGTLGIFGEPAPKKAIEVMKEIDIDLSYHRSQGLSSLLLQHASSVFVMETTHLDWITRRAPMAREKTHLLGAFGTELDSPELWDPIGKDIEAFRTSRDMISHSVTQLVAQYTALYGG